jgi:type I restriction enzyme R subunit
MMPDSDSSSEPSYSYGEAPPRNPGIKDRLIELLAGGTSDQIRESRSPYEFSPFSGEPAGLSWEYLPATKRPPLLEGTLIEEHLRDALIRLNPRAVGSPRRAGEVIGHLVSALQLAKEDGLFSAHEEWTGWLAGQRFMPFGKDRRMVPIHLLDFDDLSNNRYVVTAAVPVEGGKEPLDLVLFVNGIPLAAGVIEAREKPSLPWTDAAARRVQELLAGASPLLAPNALMFATDGESWRYGTFNIPFREWQPWRPSEGNNPSWNEAEAAAAHLLRPDHLLDLLRMRRQPTEKF